MSRVLLAQGKLVETFSSVHFINLHHIAISSKSRKHEDLYVLLSK